MAIDNKQSFLKNYINIYFFQTLSIVLGIVSLFIVVPYLSSDQNIYGIYSICLSTMIFFSYADIGFMNAGQKYAAECFARGERKEEMSYIGFAIFILFIVTVLFSFIFIYLGIKPSVLIEGITGEQQYVARRLMFILAVFAPFTALQRALQIIYGIRLKDYLLQRIIIIGNVLKIISVFYFFSGEYYNIIGYFLFIQIVGVVCSLVAIIQSYSLFHYDYKFFFHCIRFDKRIFNKTKSLAFSSLGITIAWILYYELDSFVIAKFLGAPAVAIYAVGFTVLTYFRSLLGILFAPFSVRYNHFVGKNMIAELRQFVMFVMKITFPLVIFPVIGVVIFAEPLVISWVGEQYRESIVILKWLVLCNCLAFINYPIGVLLIALEKIKLLYGINILMPFIYWVGIYFSISHIGVNAFAVFKFIIFTISGIYYIFFMFRYLRLNIQDYFNQVILPYLPALVLMVFCLYSLNDYYINGKNKELLFLNTMIMVGAIAGAIGISLFTSLPLRDCFKRSMKIILKKQ